MPRKEYRYIKLTGIILYREPLAPRNPA